LFASITGRQLFVDALLFYHTFFLGLYLNYLVHAD
jgi:hypothetical protein